MIIIFNLTCKKNLKKNTLNSNLPACISPIPWQFSTESVIFTFPTFQPNSIGEKILKNPNHMMHNTCLKNSRKHKKTKKKKQKKKNPFAGHSLSYSEQQNIVILFSVTSDYANRHILSLLSHKKWWEKTAMNDLKSVENFHSTNIFLCFKGSLMEHK